jgi:hypothetical protein
MPKRVGDRGQLRLTPILQLISFQPALSVPILYIMLFFILILI